MKAQTTNYVTYFRVSTKKQDYGIEAQKDCVSRFIESRKAQVLESFTEKESGKNNFRPELMKAIAYAKDHQATLLIAKLDRLSRNASFIMALMDNKVDFVCCDMPEANTLTIGIMAVMAQAEREQIVRRIKDVVAVLKRKGVKLGKPENLTDEGRAKAWKANKVKAQVNLNNKRAMVTIKSLRKEGKSYRDIAHVLNSEGFTTSREKLFNPIQVQRLAVR